MTGLENLESVAGFRCEDTPSLIGFEQLESLTTVTERIVIGNNDLVTSLAGFNNINNLENSFWITDNLLIDDISAFQNLNSTFSFGIKILNNPALSQCNIQAVCDNIGNTSLFYFDIENNATGCNTIPEVEASCTLAVEDVLLENIVAVFPNPVAATLTISLNPSVNFKKATVYSVLGKRVFETNTLDVDFSEMNPGVYFITIETTQGTITKKIVKE